MITSAVKNQLVTASVGVEDVDLFMMPERPFQIGIVPVNAVFVFSSDGYMPLRSFSGCGDLRSIFVEIQIRRVHEDFAGGVAKAEAVWQALQGADLSADITAFLWCRSLRSAPTYIGQNKDKHHIWTLRFEVGFMD